MREFSNRVAVVYGDTRRSFAETKDRVNRLANGLVDLGLRKGDRIGMLLNNCCEFIEIDFALAKLGIVRVPLNARLHASDHEYLLNDSGSTALFFGAEFTQLVASMMPSLNTVEKWVAVPQRAGRAGGPPSVDYDELIRDSSAKEPDSEIEEDDLHTLFYTSGTTGRPKGVMLSQRSWATVAINLALDYGPVNEDDVILNLQPLSHGAGFFVLPFFMKGATNVLMPKFEPSAVFKTIQQERVTVLKLVPAMLNRLVETPDRCDYDLSSLKSIIYGGSLAKGDHKTQGTEEEMARLKSAGKPCTNVEVRIVDEEGNDTEDGKVGEVVVRGPHIMTGYWNLPEATQETLKKGWVHTGDMAYSDAAGFIYLVDRKKDVIISGAFNIYPKEVEDVIVTHPAVKEVAVIGIPDEKWGEAVKAFVVPMEGAQITEQEVLDYCKERMASLKKPKSVDVLPELPRNPYGKIMKTALREPFWKGRERMIH
jgi:acyl-CoA synthetase (AMP-forming)/AMP-acid ligase II